MAGWSSQCGDPGCNRPTYVATLGDQGAVAFLVTGQRGLALDAAGEGVRAAEAGRLDALRNLEFAVKRQFVVTAVSWRGVEFGRREAQRAREAVELGRRRQAAGEITANDLSRLSLLLLQVEQALDQAEFGHEQARILLAQLLGMQDGAPDVHRGARPDPVGRPAGRARDRDAAGPPRRGPAATARPRRRAGPARRGARVGRAGPEEGHPAVPAPGPVRAAGRAREDGSPRPPPRSGSRCRCRCSTSSRGRSAPPTPP